MSINNGKTGFPAVYTDEHMMPAPSSKDRARRFMTTAVKTVGTLLLVGSCLGLVYQVIHDKQSYDALLTKYNALENQKMGTSGFPIDTLVRRDDPTSGSVSYVYSTTTETQATTITIRKTASSTTPSPTPTKCERPLVTVTVTVTDCPVSSTTTSSSISTTTTSSSSSITTTSSSISTTSSSSSVRLPDTVVVTHLTATTIYITDKGLVTPKVQTLTSTQLSTFTVLMTVNGTTSTSTSTADAVSGPGATPSSHLTYFPNATNPLEPYRTTAYGGVPLSTANYTITIPPAGTTTSKSDPVGTIVTVSGAHKNANVGALMLAATVISITIFF